MHVVHNWSWKPVRAVAPLDLTDVRTRNSAAAGSPVRLGAGDVQVFVASTEAPGH